MEGNNQHVLLAREIHLQHRETNLFEGRQVTRRTDEEPNQEGASNV